MYICWIRTDASKVVENERNETQFSNDKRLVRDISVCHIQFSDLSFPLARSPFSLFSLIHRLISVGSEFRNSSNTKWISENALSVCYGDLKLVDGVACKQMHMFKFIRMRLINRYTCIHICMIVDGYWNETRSLFFL